MCVLHPRQTNENTGKELNTSCGRIHVLELYGFDTILHTFLVFLLESCPVELMGSMYSSYARNLAATNPLFNPVSEVVVLLCTIKSSGLLLQGKRKVRRWVQGW